MLDGKLTNEYASFRAALARRLHAEGKTAAEIRAVLRNVDAKAKRPARGKL